MKRLYKATVVDQIRDALAALPKTAPRDSLRSAEMVDLLAEDILALVKRGYRLDAITHEFQKVGVDITDATLKRHLRSRFPRGRKISRRSKRDGDGVGTDEAIALPLDKR